MIPFETTFCAFWCLSAMCGNIVIVAGLQSKLRLLDVAMFGMARFIDECPSVVLGTS